MPIHTKPYLIKDFYLHEYYEVRTIEYEPYSNHYSHHMDSFGGFHSFGSIDHHYDRHYTISTSIRGRCTSSRENTQNFAAPDLSEFASLQAELETLIEKNNAAGLAQKLRADFILKYNEIETKDNFHCDTERERQGHVYTNQLCTVQPNIEYLIVNHNAAFRQLLTKAENTEAKSENKLLRAAFLQSLTKLDLSNADLSHLNIENANLDETVFTNAHLTGTNISNASCKASDFRKCNLNRKQLASCKTYLNAKLNSDFWPYWTPETKDAVLQGLEKLKLHCVSLRDQGKANSYEALAQAEKLIAEIKKPDTKFNEAFQRAFLKDLHKYDHAFKDDDYYQRIIKEITLCIVTGIVGYVIAGAIHKYLTGDFRFFGKSEYTKKIAEIDGRFEHKAELQPVKVFLMGMHPRAGKNSMVNRFFGNMNGKPNQPHGDIKPLKLIQDFMP